jgi:hypothetical protein
VTRDETRNLREDFNKEIQATRRDITDYSVWLGGHNAGSRDQAACSGGPNEAHRQRKRRD